MNNNFQSVCAIRPNLIEVVENPLVWSGIADPFVGHHVQYGSQGRWIHGQTLFTDKTPMQSQMRNIGHVETGKKYVERGKKKKEGSVKHILKSFHLD